MLDDALAAARKAEAEAQRAYGFGRTAYNFDALASCVALRSLLERLTEPQEAAAEGFCCATGAAR